MTTREHKYGLLTENVIVMRQLPRITIKPSFHYHLGNIKPQHAAYVGSLLIFQTKPLSPARAL